MHSFPHRFRTASALLLAALALPAAAARLEIQGGLSYMDRYATPTAFVEGVFAEHPLGDSRFTWAPDVSFGWFDGRDIARYRDNRYTTRDHVWLLAGGARFHYGDAGDWYWPIFVSFQPALHTGRTQALSTSYAFASSIGWQGQRFSFQLRHVSNGSLHDDPNRGETMALVGVALNP